MRFLNLQALNAASLGREFSLLVSGLSHANATSLTYRASSLDDWLEQGSQKALQGILNNIGSGGSKVDGASTGIVVASPSKSDPDYFYTWTRDAAMVMKAIVDEYIAGNDDLQPIIHNYISAQAKVQVITNPSGDLESGGLGEAKFNVNETAFTGSWGRPQRDGPALRAITLATYAEWLIDNGHASTAKSIVWPIMLNDLSYVGQYWNATGFDLWEEVKGSSFFTTAVQHRALVQGNSIAKSLGVSCHACTTQAPQVLCLLQSYWTGSYIDSNLGSGRSGKDANSILGSIELFNPAATQCDDTTFQPCSAKALANLKVVVDSFRDLYEVNRETPKNRPVAIGRYPEDVYYGGNPWYLTTYAAAEQLYDAIYQWKKIGKIDVDDVSYEFFKDIDSYISKKLYASGTEEFDKILNTVKSYADGFFDVTFSKDDGHQLSAEDLTWSYTAFLTAANRRRAIVPGPWDESAVRNVPDNCKATAAIGVYATPTNTEWPTSLPSGTPTPAPTPTLPPSCSEVAVRFNEQVTTSPGQDIYIAGSIPQLGSWNPDKAVLLKADMYTSDHALWYATVRLPVGETVKYKYLRKENGGKDIVWENGDDRTLKIPRVCDVEVSTGDAWK
ncbi:hypothetical protein KEM56_000427 [Ascosphaera pollenicola]|nr:hypothetical protein KEM56_000427 [Ascosphaera pollenicola]